MSDTLSSSPNGTRIHPLAAGIETIFATNHVGTNILLPLIERTAAAAGSARIVNTSSSLHRPVRNSTYLS